MAKGYKEGLRWIIANDDCNWLDEENGITSVTACFLADMFGKDDEQVEKDLKKMRNKIVNQS